MGLEGIFSDRTDILTACEGNPDVGKAFLELNEVNSTIGRVSRMRDLEKTIPAHCDLDIDSQKGALASFDIYYFQIDFDGQRITADSPYIFMTVLKDTEYTHLLQPYGITSTNQQSKILEIKQRSGNADLKYADWVMCGDFAIPSMSGDVNVYLSVLQYPLSVYFQCDQPIGGISVEDAADLMKSMYRGRIPDINDRIVGTSSPTVLVSSTRNILTQSAPTPDYVAVIQ
jgi:hypothetical protein